MTLWSPKNKTKSLFLALFTSRVTAVTPRATEGVLQLKPCIATTTTINLPPGSQSPKFFVAPIALQLSTHQRRAHYAWICGPKVQVPPHLDGEMEGDDDDDEWQGQRSHVVNPCREKKQRWKGLAATCESCE